MGRLPPQNWGGPDVKKHLPPDEIYIRSPHSSSFQLIYLHFSSTCSHPPLSEIKDPIN
jgi:hypothetical protein